MIALPLKLRLLLFVSLCAFAMLCHAQNCINKFSSIKFQQSTFDIFYRSVVTAGNEIVSAGKLFDYNSAAHIAKYSSNGNPLWSYMYNLDFFDFIKLIFFKAVNISDVVSTADGGLVVAGNVEQVLSPFGLPPPVKKWGLMAKLDRFGKVLWTKTFTKTGEMSVTNLCVTAGGDVIAYLGTDNGLKRGPGDHSYNDVIRVGPAGEIRWSTFLFTILFDAGGLGVDSKRAMLQAANGNIIIGDVLHKTDPLNGAIKEGNLHFFELDYNTGKLNWETSYEYPVPASDTAYVPELLNVKELPNGKLSFITTLYLPTGSTGNFVKKGVSIITSNRGVLDHIVAYAAADPSPCIVTDAAVDKNNGQQTLLLENAGKKTLVNIDADGQIIWQQGYNDEQGLFPINCFSAGSSGYNIFRSNNNSRQYSLLITDLTGAIDCVSEPSSINATTTAFNYSHDSVVTNLNYGYRDAYYDYAHPLKRGDEHPLTKTIECQQTLACCTDIINKTDINNISICEGHSYMLPDSTVIQDSGLYYVTFKTALGCDSIRFYQINKDKDISLLTLGSDTCLTGTSTITLNATAGFEKYYWMNNLLPGNATFPIAQAGTYYVNVNNACGNKTDSITIFDACDYPMYMPNAFTPNGDQINDVFRIPVDNKNRLLSFSIYNRWGKLMFQTSNPATGWDGYYKGEPLATDTFIYWIVMEGLSGKSVTKKGYVTLIR
jgi:gliding motility-associated-like protein